MTPGAETLLIIIGALVIVTSALGSVLSAHYSLRAARASEKSADASLQVATEISNQWNKIILQQKQACFETFDRATENPLDLQSTYLLDDVGYKFTSSDVYSQLLYVRSLSAAEVQETRAWPAAVKKLKDAMQQEIQTVSKDNG